MSLKDFEGSEIEKTALHELSSLVYQQYKSKYHDFVKLLDIIENYCREKNEKTFEAFIKYAIRSRLLKQYNIEYDELIKMATQTIDEFNKLMKELYHGSTSN